MQEDILEQEEQEPAKKKKAPKPPKPPKQKVVKPPKPVAKKPSPAASGSKGKKSGGAVACVFLVVLVIAGAMIVYFNVGGSAEAVIGILESNLPEEETIYEGLSIQELENKENELIKFEQTLEKRKKNIDRKEEGVLSLEKELGEREKTLSGQLAAFEQESSEVYAIAKAQTDIKATAQIYEKMDAQKAAEAMSRLKPVSRIAHLLKAMDSQKAALILERIDSKLAASISMAMLD